ncbi:hypothetical protein [Verrucomicrobium sp. BvORR106]|uniref:hypothetical protein n=1 Tax=Verrucomicrobium sp. BvORR106 TaxID=1403819 RepID=UPI000691806E|nr:hypothetical protein [Verrucomicrobium sp. BvORR106]
MAITLSANYSKKLGLPAFSSHSFSASVQVELTDLSQAEAECRRLYQMLQQSVDREIQHVGFVPDPCTYGIVDGRASFGNGPAPHKKGRRLVPITNGQVRSSHGTDAPWLCTEGQRGFILRLVSDYQLDKHLIDELALQLFGVGVRQLNKMQASQLIDELLAQVGKPRQSRLRHPTLNGHAHDRAA